MDILQRLFNDVIIKMRQHDTLSIRTNANSHNVSIKYNDYIAI